MSSMDRIYATAPGWILRTLQMYAYTGAPPDRMLNSGFSDHSVVVTIVAQRRMVQARSRRTYPQQVYRIDTFAEALLAMERQADWGAQSAFAALAHHTD